MPEVNEFFGVCEISVFNDGDLDVIQEHIQIAMKRNVDFEVKTWKNGEFIFQSGKITWIDLNFDERAEYFRMLDEKYHQPLIW